MTYNPDWCIVCGDEEDNGWGNKISLEFKQTLVDKGYYITNHGTDICPDCLIKIIKPNEGDN